MVTVSLKNKRILVADHDPAMLDRVLGTLAQSGYEGTRARSAAEALHAVSDGDFDAVILDLQLPPGELAEFVRSLRAHSPDLPVLLLAEASRLPSAVQALRHGADDYLLRPPDPFELSARLGRILEGSELDSRISTLQDELAKKYQFRNPVGRSPAMEAVVERIRRVAPMRATVLILGESGVGKELVARAIHFNSTRRDQPFIALNCAAIPATLIESELFGHERGAFTGAHVRARGKFEIAHRGTLFLDEISEMSPSAQAKLLRVLEEREFMRVGGDRNIRVDVRVIAATNADLESAVEEGTFRQDLYYRLKVVTISVPPLRERRADIPVLVETFLDDLSRANAVVRKKIAPDAMAALESYAWPGNVRELKNLIESVLVGSAGDVIRLDELPSNVHRGMTTSAGTGYAPGTTLEEMERDLIQRTLQYAGGNRTHAAELLGIGVRTLQRKIHSFGMNIRPQRRRPRRSKVHFPS